MNKPSSQTATNSSQTIHLPSPSRAERLERLVEISRILVAGMAYQPVLQAIVETAVELTQAEACSVLRLNEAQQNLRFEAGPWFQLEELRSIVVPVKGSAAGQVLQTGRPLIIQNADQDPRIRREVDEILGFKTSYLIALPLVIKEKPLGVLEVVNRVVNEPFNNEDLDTLTTLAAQAATVLETMRLEGSLSQTSSDLTQLDRMKTNFIAIASHELRTPLGLILGHGSFLREMMQDEELQEQLDIIMRASTRMKTIIDDLADLAHIDRQEAEFEHNRFVLEELIKEVTQEAQGLLSSKQLVFRTQLPNTPTQIEADRGKIHIVITNMLENAIRFTPIGGRVVIKLESTNSQVMLQFQDTGIGIPANQINRIFERFYQVESHLTRRYEGMGLGLSIVKEIVEAHQGSITVKSVEGQGSVFTITLPRARTR